MQASETSVPLRLATDVDEHQFGHGQRDSEVQGVSGKEEAKQRDEEVEEGNAAKAATDLGAPSAVKGAKHTVSHWPYRILCPHCVRERGGGRQHKAAANTERTTRVLSADHCFRRTRKHFERITGAGDDRF